MHIEDVNKIEAKYGKRIEKIGPSFSGSTRLEDGSERATTFTPITIGGKRRVFNHATGELQ